MTDPRPNDALETLLQIVLDEDPRACISNGASEPDPWFVFMYPTDGYSQYNPPEPGWDINVYAPTLRAALCAAIAHPSFGAN